MNLPYPTPEYVKTNKRCQFGLPGKKYDCRRIGAYLLNGKRYCAPHYDTVWKMSNPIYGQQHEWHIHINRFTGTPNRYPTCKRCGDIQPHDGLSVLPCDGKMPVITLRAGGYKA